MTARSCRVLLAALAALLPLPLHGQEEAPDALVVRAGAAQDVLIGDPVVFDASGSSVPPGAEVTYTWFFGDGATTTGERVTHAYRRTGSYLVQLAAQVGEETREETTRVSVYAIEHLLLTDDTVRPEMVLPLTQAAAEENILLTTLRVPPDAPTVAEGLARQAVEQRQTLERAPLLLVWTSSTRGPDMLASLGQSLSALEAEKRRRLHVEEKGVVLVTDQPFPLVARPAQTAYNILRPQYILLTRPEALPRLVHARTADAALAAVREAGTPFTILGAHSERAVTRLTPWNALSYSVNTLVNAGVPTSSIIIILMLPIVATLLAAARQVIGIKAFGIFTPAAVTLAFLAIGLKYGLMIFAAVLFAATASRFLLRRFRLLYLPRMAIVLTAVSLAVLGLFGVGALFRQTGILAFSVFPILLLASLAEQFVEAQIRLGFRAAARLTLETLALAVVATLIADWETLRSFVVGFPEVTLLTIPVNILLGRWTGLRLTEYLRFRRLLFPAPTNRPP